MATGCKKVVATGARTMVLVMEERCFGVQNAKISDLTTYLGTWKRLELTSESIVNEISTLQSNALNPFRGVLRRTQGTQAVGGDLNVELSGNGYAYLITQAIGKIIGTGVSSDPYTILPVDDQGVASDATAGYKQDPTLYNPTEIHYDVSASDVASDSAGFESGYYEVDAYNLEPGMTFMVSRDGGTIKNELDADPVNHLWFEFTGMKVNTWSISATPTEIVTSTFGLMGRGVEIRDYAIPTYIERPEVNDPFTGFNGAVTIDGVAQCVKKFELNLNNNLNADQFCMGEKFRNSLPEQQKIIEGSLDIEFTNLVYYTKFVNQTSSVLVVTFDLLDDGTETMKIILPKIEYNGTMPTAAGQDAIIQSLPFIAMWDLTPANTLLVKGAATVAPNGFDIAIEIVTAGALV